MSAADRLRLVRDTLQPTGATHPLPIGDGPPQPGTSAHFDWLLAQMRDYWDTDATYMARSIREMGLANAASVLNRMGKETWTTPPALAEITAVEATVWDNWHSTNGKRPKEGQPNHDKARRKVTVEVWNAPVGVAMWGGGNRAQNSIYSGTAIIMDHAALSSYIADKRAGKKIKEPWSPGTPHGDLALFLEQLREQYPEALIGPLCWTSNKKAFVPGMAVVVEQVENVKQMRVTVMYPDGAHQFALWSTKRPNGTTISGKHGEVAYQCRATNRADQSAWRNSKLA